MWQLRQKNLFDNVIHGVVTKPITPEVEDSKQMIKYAWNSSNNSEDLDNWVKANSVNEKKYFKYAPKPEFEQKVRDNLAILEKYENRDENGEPTVSQTILNKNEEYQKAKRWLRRNARSVFVEKGDDSWIFDYNKAIEYLTIAANNNIIEAATLLLYLYIKEYLLTNDEYVISKIYNIKESIERHPKYNNKIKIEIENNLKKIKANNSIDLTLIF